MDEIIGTSSVEFVGDKDRVREEELAVFTEKLRDSDLKVTLIDSLTEAIHYALDQVQPGDVVLLAGSQGMDRGGENCPGVSLAKHPEGDKEELFSPLDGRVSDMDA